VEYKSFDDKVDDHSHSSSTTTTTTASSSSKQKSNDPMYGYDIRRELRSAKA
jgi:hypothetical protein